MEEAQVAHLAGVFDVAGSIKVTISKNESYSLGYEYQPVVELSRPPSDSDPLLGKIIAYCDDEVVRHNIIETENKYRFSIKRAEDISRFLEPMLPYFVSRLEEASTMVHEIAPQVVAGDHNSKEGFLRLMPAADKLRARTGRSSKYTTDYFEKEWDMSAEEVA